MERGVLVLLSPSHLGLDLFDLLGEMAWLVTCDVMVKILSD
jgi:hypothetical protein